MSNQLNDRENFNRLNPQHKYRGLKFSALGVAAIAIILMLSMIIWMDDIPQKAKLVMEGCVGLCAIIFVILTGILAYRINVEQIANRRK